MLTVAESPMPARVQLSKAEKDNSGHTDSSKSRRLKEEPCFSEAFTNDVSGCFAFTRA